MSYDIVERLRLVADADCRETARDWTFEPADGHRWADLMDQAADEIKRLRGNFTKALTAMGAALDCLEQNIDDPDTVAIGILREAMYFTSPTVDAKGGE